MGKVQTTWLLPGHSGRACKHEDIYTKRNRKTNQVYSVKLCNPVSDWSDKQTAQRTNFATLASGIAQWIKTNKELDSADYKKVKSMYDRQCKYATLRGFIYAKGYATVGADGKVVISIAGNQSVVTKPSGGNTNNEEETM